MPAKTYDGQTARFLATVATCMPSLSGEVMQGWIDNPSGLKKYLSGLNPPVVKISLFTHVGVLDFPGLPAFSTDSVFTTETPEGAKVKFYNVGKNFTGYFGGMVVAATRPSKLSFDRLSRDAYDVRKEGTDDLGVIEAIGEENVDQSLALIRWHIESGQAKEDRWYAGYFKDKSGVRRAVRWFWRGGGWGVDALPAPYPNTWAQGFEFLSRKPLVA